MPLQSREHTLQVHPLVQRTLHRTFADPEAHDAALLVARAEAIEVVDQLAIVARREQDDLEVRRDDQAADSGSGFGRSVDDAEESRADPREAHRDGATGLVVSEIHETQQVETLLHPRDEMPREPLDVVHRRVAAGLEARGEVLVDGQVVEAAQVRVP